MGYTMELSDSSFFMKKKDIIPAMNAVKKLSNTDLGGFHFPFLSDLNFSQKIDFSEIVLIWGWYIDVDDKGDVVEIFYEGDELQSDELLFETIAPFVKEDSFIEMRGEDGVLWRWVFTDGKCLRIDAEIVFNYKSFKRISDQTMDADERDRLTKMVLNVVAKHMPEGPMKKDVCNSLVEDLNDLTNEDFIIKVMKYCPEMFPECHLTSEEYVKSNGAKSPCCGSTDIDSEAIELDDNYAWSNCSCNKCGSEWMDIYNLVGYESLTNNTTV